MVALKPVKSAGSPEAAGRKQERRGGIETLPAQQPEGPVLPEAGTPWWH